VRCTEDAAAVGGSARRTRRWRWRTRRRRRTRRRGSAHGGRGGEGRRTEDAAAAGSGAIVRRDQKKKNRCGFIEIRAPVNPMWQKVNVGANLGRAEEQTPVKPSMRTTNHRSNGTERFSCHTE
jgi:hypothetical protein